LKFEIVLTILEQPSLLSVTVKRWCKRPPAPAAMRAAR
jgi:hypothetical protein